MSACRAERSQQLERRSAQQLREPSMKGADLDPASGLEHLFVQVAQCRRQRASICLAESARAQFDLALGVAAAPGRERRQPLVQPHPHFACGLAGKRDRQDLLRLAAIEQGAQDPRHQHPCLAGTGARLDRDTATRIARRRIERFPRCDLSVDSIRRPSARLHVHQAAFAAGQWSRRHRPAPRNRRMPGLHPTPAVERRRQSVAARHRCLVRAVRRCAPRPDARRLDRLALVQRQVHRRRREIGVTLPGEQRGVERELRVLLRALDEGAQPFGAACLVVDQLGRWPVRSNHAVDAVDDAVHLDAVPFRRMRAQVDLAALPAGTAGVAPVQPFDVARRHAREGGGERQEGRGLEMALLLNLLRNGQQSRLFRGGSVRRMPGGLEALQNLMKPCAEVPLLDFVVELLGIAQPSMRNA
jgi:hypothetical protein